MPEDKCLKYELLLTTIYMILQVNLSTEMVCDSHKFVGEE